jgi:cholesterol transport system auxiliary component
VKARTGRAALIACAWLIPGCTLLSPVNLATPAYATTQMAYSTQAYQIGYFTTAEWAAKPSEMIQPLVVQTLRNTHYFGEVLLSPDFRRHTFVLAIEVQELRQDFTTEPATLRLTMHVTLTRAATNEAIVAQELSAHQPMSERTPYAGVKAANEAVSKLLGQIAELVVAKTD